MCDMPIKNQRRFFQTDLQAPRKTSTRDSFRPHAALSSHRTRDGPEARVPAPPSARSRFRAHRHGADGGGGHPPHRPRARGGGREPVLRQDGEPGGAGGPRGGGGGAAAAARLAMCGPWARRPAVARRLAFHHPRRAARDSGRGRAAPARAHELARSSLCKTALICCADVVRAYGDAAFEFLEDESREGRQHDGSGGTGAPSLMHTLLHKAALDKRFVMDEAKRTLLLIIERLDPDALVREILLARVESKNDKVRAVVAMCLREAVDESLRRAEEHAVRGTELATDADGVESDAAASCAATEGDALLRGGVVRQRQAARGARARATAAGDAQTLARRARRRGERGGRMADARGEDAGEIGRRQDRRCVDERPRRARRSDRREQTDDDDEDVFVSSRACVVRDAWLDDRSDETRRSI